MFLILSANNVDTCVSVNGVCKTREEAVKQLRAVAECLKGDSEGELCVSDSGYSLTFPNDDMFYGVLYELNLDELKEGKE